MVPITMIHKQMFYAVLNIAFCVFLFTSGCAPQNNDVIQTRKNLEAHVQFLASDAMKGRKPGSPEIEQAASYLAKEFKDAGVAPLGDNYRQSFEVITGVSMDEGNEYTVLAGRSAPTSFVAGENFTPIGLSSSTKASGKLFFVGYGISAEDENYDDYSGLDVKNAIVVMFRGFPQFDNAPHGPFANFAELHYKLINAREKGAAGAILVDTHDMRDALIPLSAPEMSNVNGIAAIHAKREIIGPLFGSPANLKEVEQKILNNKAPASRRLGNWEATINVALEIQKAQTANVIGMIPGTNSELRDEVIIVGAHYDHLGMGGAGSRDSGGEPAIHNGADDNASGTAAVLEIGRLVAANPLPRPVVVMGFSAEEMGLLGSAYYVQNPLLELENSAVMINLDMIGRMENRKLVINGTGTASEWPEMLDSLQAIYNFQITRNKDGFGPSDHSSFYSMKMPVLSLFTGLHDDYHRPEDDTEKINFGGMDSLTHFTYDIVKYIATQQQKPTFVEAAEAPRARSSMSFRVRMGTVPDYNDNPKGMRITGVKVGSPAEKAGLKGGDIITAFGDLEIKNIYDYTFALGKFSPGDVVLITILRDEKVMELSAELEAL